MVSVLDSLAALQPMEAKLVAELPEDPGWRFEPKWDGFRCLASKHGRTTSLTAKSGKPLARYFPEVVAALKELGCDRITLDGELLVRAGRTWSFEALQSRLHPAQSRIDKLSLQTPATLMVFDILEAGGKDVRSKPLSVRRGELGKLVGPSWPKTFLLSPGTSERSRASRWLSSHEGVIAKRLGDPYLGGERAMLKVKRRRTADCVVGGFRYAAGSALVGSLLLGLYNEREQLDHVGFTSGFGDMDRSALTRKLEALRGGPGFSGNAPGAPSRWSGGRSSEWAPLRPRLVVEVSYDHVSGGRFRHGTRLLRLRPDKAPDQCTSEQIMT